MDNTQQRLCSVVIPTYNCQMYIKDTVKSVLNQTYSNLEIILIDDCSSDDTYQIIQGLADQDNRIHALKNKKNYGVAKTRNIGFGIASGDYIALLDGDDVWYPDKLAIQIPLLDKTAADFCYTSYSFIDENGNSIGRLKNVPTSCTIKKLLEENYILPSTVLLRKEVIKKHKMSSQYSHEDFVFWLELLQNGYKVYGCTQSLVKYRISKAGRSHNKFSAAKSRWLVYRNYLHLSFLSSLHYFCVYTLNGFRKYSKLK